MLSFSELLSQESGVVHGFSTREGGCSVGHLSSLNLKFGLESAEVTRLNWGRLESTIGPTLLPSGIATVNQVHGNAVVEALGVVDAMTPIADADAMFTTQRGLGLAVFTADCVPVLLSGGGVVAAVHAGWRGTAKGIVQACLVAIKKATGVDAGSLVASIGPAIGPWCYEVSEDVVGALGSLVDESLIVSANERGGTNVDLPLANELQLRQAGVGRVERLSVCTLCGGKHFSYRGDGGITGRQISVIGLSV